MSETALPLPWHIDAWANDDGSWTAEAWAEHHGFGRARADSWREAIDLAIQTADEDAVKS